MTAFGSHCDRNAPAFENAVVIAVSNSVFSVLSGVCLFGVMGYVTSAEGDFRIHAGPSLLFGVYPAALSTVPGGLHWVRFLFFNFVLLGLDSAFALVESVAALIADSRYGGGGEAAARPRTVGAGCLAGFLVGLLYTTDGGLVFLDTVDFYVNFAVLFLGFCKALTAGWIRGMRQQVRNLGDRWNIVYAYYCTTFGSFLFASLVWFGVKGETFWLGLLSLVVIYGSGVAYCLHNLKSLAEEDRSTSMKFLRNELLMGNILELRRELSESVGYLPWAWAFLMKHVVPQVLLVLFFNLFFSQTDYGAIDFGNYGGYLVWPYQAVGVTSALLVIGTVLAGALDSNLFAFLTTGGGVGGDESDGDDEEVDAIVEMKETKDRPAPSTAEYSNMDVLESADPVVPPPSGAAALTGTDAVLA